MTTQQINSYLTTTAQFIDSKWGDANPISRSLNYNNLTQDVCRSLTGSYFSCICLSLRAAGNVENWIKVRTSHLKNTKESNYYRYAAKKQAEQILQQLKISNSFFKRPEDQLLQHLFFEAVRQANAQEIENLINNSLRQTSSLNALTFQTQSTVCSALKKIESFFFNPITTTITSVSLGLIAYNCVKKITVYTKNLAEREIVPLVMNKAINVLPSASFRIAGILYENVNKIWWFSFFGLYFIPQNSSFYNLNQKVHFLVAFPYNLSNKIKKIPSHLGTAIHQLFSSTMKKSHEIAKEKFNKADQERIAEGLKKSCEIWVRFVTNHPGHDVSTSLL